MDDIKKLYEELKKEPDKIPHNVKLYHSDIYYIKFLINYKFNKNYTIEQIYSLLIEEKLIKNKEAFEIRIEREIDKTFQQINETGSLTSVSLLFHKE